MAKFVTTKRGGQKLIFNGYGYVKQNPSAWRMRWVCEKRNSLKCKAYVSTALAIDDGDDVLQEFGVHTHAGDPLRAEIELTRSELIGKAKDSTSSTDAIVTEILTALPTLAAQGLPAIRSLKRQVRLYGRPSTTTSCENNSDHQLRSSKNEDPMDGAEEPASAVACLMSSAAEAAITITRSSTPQTTTNLPSAAASGATGPLATPPQRRRSGRPPKRRVVLRPEPGPGSPQPSQRVIDEPSSSSKRPREQKNAAASAASGADKRTECAAEGEEAAEMRALKKSVLLLQKQTYEKVNLAMDEFRRYIAEQRLMARGADLNGVPIDIPPGMDHVGLI